MIVNIVKIIELTILFPQVAGIVGRADLLCAFCVFSSFLSYIRCFSAGEFLHLNILII